MPYTVAVNAAAMPCAELRRIGEVLHDGHEAEHGADDAERGRVDAHAFVHLGGASVDVLAHADFHFENGADGVRLTAVDHQLQAALHERVLFLLDERLQAQQALLARDGAPLDDLLDQLLGLHLRRLEHPREAAHGVLEHRQRRLDENRRRRCPPRRS